MIVPLFCNRGIIGGVSAIGVLSNDCEDGGEGDCIEHCVGIKDSGENQENVMRLLLQQIKE